MVLEQRDRTPILDHGYIELIEAWGSDERIVEAARMSTSKGFQGWGPKHDVACSSHAWTRIEGAGGAYWYMDLSGGNHYMMQEPPCNCKLGPGDERLLRYLYEHKHMTPFEMAGMTVEVQAPISVFREWHRHRTQSYNELSARYTPLPDMNYRPTRERIIEGAKGFKNRQAAGVQPLVDGAVVDWLRALDAAYSEAEQTYQTGLAIGVPKELARLCVPVGRYSQMRASANLRNWMQFLTLRMAPEAQWEIRQYANEVAKLVEQQFPRTHALFAEGI